MPAWQLFPNLWVDKQVQVSCPDGQVLPRLLKTPSMPMQSALYGPLGDT